MIDLIPYLSWIFGAINLVGAIIVIHYERRRPRAAVLWLLFLFMLPAFGLILYFLFGMSIHRSRPSLKRKEVGDSLRMEAISRERQIGEPETVLAHLELSEYQGLAKMLMTNGSNLTVGNDIRLIHSGQEKFELMFRDIEAARDHVHAEYYIVRNDDLGNRFLDLLSAKAKQGVKVRLLLDDVGTRLPSATIKRLKRDGVEVAMFFPSLYRHTASLNLRVNYRNHRKIVVVDGKIGFLGGYNVGDEYLGLDKRKGRWRDTHLRVEGRAVLDLQARFLLDWDFASTRPMDVLPRYFPDVPERNGMAVQIASGGPDKRRDLIQEVYLKMIASARSRVYLQSPYFIPDESVLDALRVAALSGLDVRVMIPVLPDHPLVHWANLSFLGELLESGVKGYLYQDGFLHSKTIVVDGAIASIGSANWDIRSFELNFETNAIVYCPRLAREQEAAFMEDLKCCREWTLDEYLNRPWSVRLKGGFSRVFSPVL